MEYSKIDKLNVNPSLLGFGCMRFPKKEDGTIDEVEAERMLNHAIESGVTYIDTAYPYHDGESEPFIGRVLKKYKREDFYLATKLPMFKIDSLEQAKEIFEEQMKRLDVDYVDFYLLHALNKDTWKKVIDLNIIPYCEELKKQGRIKNFGFSFHDDYEVFEEIINYRDWDFCQIQLNYIDTDIQAGMKGYKLTEEKNVPLVIMEPIKGGALASLSDDIEKVFTDYNQNVSISSWALRFVASLPNVKVILSGMSTYAQVEDNLATFKDFKPLDQDEEKLVEKVANMIKAKTKNGCTGCRYCMPCPFGIDIPGNFKLWNEYGMLGLKDTAKRRYTNLGDAQAEFCKKCGKCEKLCPQSIKIREDLQRVVQDIKNL